MFSRADVNRKRGMAGVVHRFDVVMRTFFAAVAIVTITGVLPAMASLGSCAVKPCCIHEKGALAIAAHPACCSKTTGSMATAKPVTLAQRTDVHPTVAPSISIAPMLMTARDQSGPHPTSRSPKRSPETLSILLI